MMCSTMSCIRGNSEEHQQTAKLPLPAETVLSKIEEHAKKSFEELTLSEPPADITISDDEAEDLLGKFSYQYYAKMRPPKIIYMTLGAEFVKDRVDF